MAKKVPFFLTGANAKVKLNGRTVALCTDVEYSIKVEHVAPKVCGMYESFTIEPLSYNVTGNFTVIRYIRGLKSFVEQNGAYSPDLVDNLGNSIGSFGPNSTFEQILSTVGVPFSTEGRADQSFDPSAMANSMMFDIEVSQASMGNTLGTFARFRDCRITSSDLKISKRGNAVQSFTFQACYADEDGFSAGLSGVGQNLS